MEGDLRVMDMSMRLSAVGDQNPGQNRYSRFSHLSSTGVFGLVCFLEIDWETELEVVYMLAYT